jgi:hypothetical protein
MGVPETRQCDVLERQHGGWRFEYLPRLPEFHNPSSWRRAKSATNTQQISALRSSCSRGAAVLKRRSPRSWAIRVPVSASAGDVQMSADLSWQSIARAAPRKQSTRRCPMPSSISSAGASRARRKSSTLCSKPESGQRVSISTLKRRMHDEGYRAIPVKADMEAAGHSQAAQEASPLSQNAKHSSSPSSSS